MINIQKATEDDIPRILEIEQESNSPPWTHGALLNELYKTDSYFIIAVNNVNIIGFAILSKTGDDGELLKIAVDKFARKTGIGNLLIKAIIDYATENELESIFLEVRISNEPALNLYKKHGFKPVRTRKNYYTDPVEDALNMVKAIKKSNKILV